ncbi:hypothetical protein [Chryseolinea sp. H1M3-3]|jgi:hypothetical protein|uniref:hypothetical protein n=1 Tax=Chryseolinea sp. H1M3-3 TaxID=3034144 RepID=UPI0023EB03E1|nr:hypothetical protein [Chryseolinea sp. H1M3-3]
MAHIDQNIIINFLCTHKLDSTKVDFDPQLMEKDLIFYPVNHRRFPKHIAGVNDDRYLERMNFLFSPVREKN